MSADGCHEGATLLQATVATMTATNAQLIAQVAGLQAEVARLSAIQSSTDTKLDSGLAATQTTSTSKQGVGIAITGDGSGAGSPEAYQEMVEKNWHGRLGRAHMVDVDRMPDAARKELDCFLRRTIKAMLPVGANYTEVKPDLVFATLSAFGLRLEDRGSLADVTIFSDSSNTGVSTVSRMRNFSAYYYAGCTSNFDNYWKGSALETVLELARYRGLLNVEDFLKVVD